MGSNLDPWSGRSPHSSAFPCVAPFLQYLQVLQATNYALNTQLAPFCQPGIVSRTVSPKFIYTVIVRLTNVRMGD